VTDAGLKSIGKITTLKTLVLDKTRITDAGLKELSGLTDLEELDLAENDITDAGLKELKLKSLTSVSVKGCKKVTRVGVAALKALNPKMVVEGP
jgi:Leucine-rich repeat (LRR) protein